MALYDDFLARVLIDLHGCSEISATTAIKDTCVDFCQKSAILTRDHDPISVKQGVIDYDLEPPTGYLIVQVRKAYIDNNELTPLAADFISDPAVYNRLFPSYQANQNTPRYYLQKEPRSITIWQEPVKDYSNGLTLRVALKPTRDSTSIEDEIYEDWVDVIAAGAISRLARSPSKPYSNLQLAQLRAAEYMAGLNVARQRASHGHVRSNVSVRLRRI